MYIHYYVCTFMYVCMYVFIDDDIIGPLPGAFVSLLFHHNNRIIQVIVYIT